MILLNIPCIVILGTPCDGKRVCLRTLRCSRDVVLLKFGDLHDKKKRTIETIPIIHTAYNTQLLEEGKALAI